MSEDRRGFARVMNAPEIGFYLLRKVKGGPLVAARIWRPCHCTVNGGDASVEHAWSESCDRFPPLCADINGQPTDPVDLWHRRSARISEGEYRYLRDAAAWDRKHAPEAPAANPDKPIDLLTTPTLF